MKCLKCDSNTGMEIIQPNQYACKECRTLFIASKITDEEMIEWFCN